MLRGLDRIGRAMQRRGYFPSKPVVGKIVRFSFGGSGSPSCVEGGSAATLDQRALWVVHLLSFPHRQDGGGHLSRHRQLREMGFGAPVAETLVGAPERIGARAVDRRRRRTLEDVLEHGMVVGVEAAR